MNPTIDAAADRAARIIAFGNQKGGVGKTTTTVQLGTALAEKGRGVLIWDLDMNCGATRHFGLPEGQFAGTYEIMCGAERAADLIVTPSEWPNLPKGVDLLPASVRLEGIEQFTAARKSSDPFFVPMDLLVEPLAELSDRYDYILLDTSPNMTLPTICAYRAAQFFILTSSADMMSLSGLEPAIDYIRKAQRHTNPGLKLAGLVMWDADLKKATDRQIKEHVDRLFDRAQAAGEHLHRFETVIDRSTYVRAAQATGRTILQHRPKDKVSNQYRALAGEVEQRLAALSDQTRTAVVAADAQVGDLVAVGEGGLNG